MTSARRGEGACAGIAQRSACRIACATWADLISVFDGTQPYHRQSPPILCFSTSATFAPSDAARGDDQPAGPAADHHDVELGSRHQLSPPG